ncbi:unnamed protein product [Orchesella dallaii]|uniref:Nuclease HARBI1 n=1 Tax=Orchesella dallaii TaxID=48710 RepID=A0ABP1QLS3_9HEXA
MTSRLLELEEKLERRRRFGRIPLPRLRDRSNPMMVLDEIEFQRRFHASKETVVFVYGLIKNDVEKPFKRGAQIPPMIQLLVALRYYATGSFQIVVGDLYGVHQSSVSRILKRISCAIGKHARRFIQFTSFAEVLDVRRKFYEIGGFPGTHLFVIYIITVIELVHKLIHVKM